jgi:DNA-binding MarR family transcriptional regulator
MSFTDENNKIITDEFSLRNIKLLLVYFLSTVKLASALSEKLNISQTDLLANITEMSAKELVESSDEKRQELYNIAYSFYKYLKELEEIRN